MTKPTVLLSQLEEGVTLSHEGTHAVYTPHELREAIGEGDNYLLNKEWYICIPQEWKPDAKHMVNEYIEDEYNNGIYEDWDERARECLTQDHYDKIQAVLDDAFKGDSATKYWTLEGARVIIDCSLIMDNKEE